MSKGLKRICMNCGMRFYDLDKNPIICPSCDTEFTGEIKVKARRGRVAAIIEDKPVVKEVAKPADGEEDDDVADIDADDDIVSLDDVDEDDDLDDEDDDDDVTLPIEDDDLDDDLDDLDDDEEEEDDVVVDDEEEDDK